MQCNTRVNLCLAETDADDICSNIFVTALTYQTKQFSSLYTNQGKCYDGFMNQVVTFIVTEKCSLEGTEL